MVALGLMSSCWAGKVRAGVTAQYREELSLYGVAVSDVGERKSACFAMFERPARIYEAERSTELAWNAEWSPSTHSNFTLFHGKVKQRYTPYLTHEEYRGKSCSP